MVNNYRKRQAILCGVSDYSNLMGGYLPTVEQEIFAIDEALSNKLHEDYRYKVTSLLNENVTLADLPTIFAPHKQDSPTDELLFYFSGHGTIYNGEPYFVTYGAESNNPGIKLSDLATEVSSLHPGIKQIFLILDFCHSGGILKAISVIGSERVSVLTATRQFQVAEVTTQDGKPFAQHFIDGTTNAPANNGEISFGQLAHYIKEQMKTSYVQSPSFFSIGDVAINKINTKFFVPYKRNPFFTGREEILAQIHTRLSSNSNVSISQPPAISGLGGIGKTQTALEFCHRHLNDYQTILWINAETEISFNVSCSKIVKLLNLPLTNTFTKISDTNEKQTVETLVCEWLMNNSNWLMVLDNLEDTKLIKDYLPSNHQGHVLITTQQHDLGVIAKTITLDKMDSNTGSLFLLKRIELLSENDSLDKADPNDSSVAQEIVKEMDGLPLALDQAGAYIRQTPSSLQEYLDLYKNAKHAAKLRKNRGKHTDDHISVTATFQLAFDKVKGKTSIAAKVLEVCSFLNPNLIPEEIFTSASHFLNDGFAALVDDPLAWNEVLEALSDYSLVKRDTNNKSLSIHRLVQAVIRDLIGEQDKKILVESSIKTLWSLSNDSAEEDPNNWPFYQKLLPSVTSLFNFTKCYQSSVIEAAYLFHQFGIYCYKQALFPQSLDFSNLVLKIKKQCFGNKHPDIANTFINISSIYKTQGKYTQALDSLTQALSIKKSLYSDKHPDIALILNNMGTIYDSIGKYTKALDYYKQALSIRKHLFGDNHPDVAQTLNNIALVYKTLGKYNDALDYIKQALSIIKESFGDNHLNVADILINMGEIYREKGCYVDALDSYNQALSISKNHFDDDHLNVAEILENIAIVYQAQNKHDAALDYLKKSLSTYKKYFGEHHLSVAKALENIGNSYMHNKEYKLALDNYRQTLSIKKDFLGENHRDVAGTLNNIGAVYYYQNNFKEALSFFKQSLSIRKQLFSDNHPDVKETLNNIALVHQSQSKNDEAKLLRSSPNSLSKPLNQSNQQPNNNITFNISNGYPLKLKK